MTGTGTGTGQAWRQDATGTQSRTRGMAAVTPPVRMRPRPGPTEAITALALSALVGCVGGQTGEDRGGDARRNTCVESGVTIGLHDPLPLGFSARELIDSAVGTHAAPAYWLPFADTTTGPPRLADDATTGAVSTEVTLELEYTGPDQLPLFEGDCPWHRLGVKVPARAHVTTADGTFEQTYEGQLLGRPASPQFASEEIDHPADLAFTLTADGPRGSLNTTGRRLQWPSRCPVAYDELALTDKPAPWPLSPADMLATFASMSRWQGQIEGEQEPLSLSVTPDDGPACAQADPAPSSASDLEGLGDPGLVVPVVIGLVADGGAFALMTEGSLEARFGGDHCRFYSAPGEDDCVELALSGTAETPLSEALSERLGGNITDSRLILQVEGVVVPEPQLTGRLTLSAAREVTSEDGSESWLEEVDAAWTLMPEALDP